MKLILLCFGLCLTSYCDAMSVDVENKAAGGYDLRIEPGSSDNEPTLLNVFNLGQPCCDKEEGEGEHTHMPLRGCEGLEDGVQTIYPNVESSEDSFSVNCVDDGWTVIQSRGQFGNPHDFFSRNWTDYKAGFGTPGEEHWVGLDNMHWLTEGRNVTLRVTLTASNGMTGVGFFDQFWIGSEDSNYTLNYGSYHAGPNAPGIGDSLSHHNGMQFTTLDVDNDEYEGYNCSQDYDSDAGWWFNYCENSNLNGLNADVNGDIVWDTFNESPIEAVEMAVKATHLV